MQCEHAASLSGRGFSLVHDAPRYQQEAIEHYFNISNPPYKYFTNGDYNKTGKYNRNGLMMYPLYSSVMAGESVASLQETVSNPEIRVPVIVRGVPSGDKISMP